MPHAYNDGLLVLFWRPTQDVSKPRRLDLPCLFLLLALFLCDHLGLSTNLPPATCPKPGYYEGPKCNQCLDNIVEICDKCSAKGDRMRVARQYHFKYCDGFPLFYALNRRDPYCDLDNISPDECRACLQPLQDADHQAYATFQEFKEMLKHFDCHATFSSQWNCTDCESAYRDWTCSLHIPFYNITTKETVLPCSDYCQGVEERCPYLLPHMDQQYAGEPSFLCTVSYIPHQASNLSGAKECHKLSEGGVVVQALSDGLSTSLSSNNAAKVDAQTGDDASTAASAASSASSSASGCSGRTLRCHVVSLLLVAQLACLWYYRTLQSHTLYRVIGFT